MTYNQILLFLNKDKKLPHEEEQHVRKYFRAATARKKDIILRSGSICDKFFFINKGIIRAYFYNGKGIKITRMIACENQFLTNMMSFRTLSSNMETFECLENTEYLYITRQDMDKLLACAPTFPAKYCEILEIYNAVQVNHIHFITNSDVREKVHYLKTNFPDLTGRLSDHILASFIGVSRETFSRNKGKLY